MDGNGRWATTKGLARKDGHREGTLAIDRLMDTAIELNIKNISLYAFSTENWKRPISEVRSIFSLLEEFIDSRLESIHKKNIKILHSGSRKMIPSASLKRIDRGVKTTAKNTGIVINFCLNYGSQDEILNAFHKIIQNRIKKNKNLEKEVKQSEMEEALYTYPLPPVDMLIRTAGEKRVSNFLLWQIAYAEIYFTDILWPDFDKAALKEALNWYTGRTRKFGGLEK
ncbi:MAG: di-trans,poly-cis-decaprenylcistransferase [Leptospiraceae bacterium]|nr:di-trans,poly-cis-decaprenylcistransferase [Leptospiraceae bacterium]